MRTQLKLFVGVIDAGLVDVSAFTDPIGTKYVAGHTSVSAGRGSNQVKMLWPHGWRPPVPGEVLTITVETEDA